MTRGNYSPNYHNNEDDFCRDQQATIRPSLTGAQDVAAGGCWKRVRAWGRQQCLWQAESCSHQEHSSAPSVIPHPLPAPAETDTCNTCRHTGIQYTHVHTCRSPCALLRSDGQPGLLSTLVARAGSHGAGPGGPVQEEENRPAWRQRECGSCASPVSFAKELLALRARPPHTWLL